MRGGGGKRSDNKGGDENATGDPKQGEKDFWIFFGVQRTNYALQCSPGKEEKEEDAASSGVFLVYCGGGVRVGRG